VVALARQDGGVRSASGFCRVAEWSGLVMCMLVLAVPLLTRSCVPVWPISGWNCAVATGQGGLLFFWVTDKNAYWPGPGLFGPRVSGPEWFRNFWTPRAQYQSLRWTPYISGGKPFGILFVPSWIPSVIVAMPTAYLLYRGRRTAKPGHCRECGYDLTGNLSGRCPECGHRARTGLLEGP